jgi:hypothetical protein
MKGGGIAIGGPWKPQVSIGIELVGAVPPQELDPQWSFS